MTTSSDMIALLRRHYLPENRPPGGVFAPEIGSPDGRRRADLIWLPTTTAGGQGLVGHEVKVSRSDVCVELADPTKAEPWAQFCNRWWLVVSDPALVDGLTIPDAWGIMAPPSGRRTRSMTVVKRAPKLTPRNAAPGLERLLSSQLYRTNDTIAELRREVSWRDRTITSLRDDLSKARLAGGGYVSPYAERVRSLVAEVEKRARGGVLYTPTDVTDDAVVEAAVDLANARALATSARRDVETMIRDVERIVEPFRHIKRDLSNLLDNA